MAQTKEIPLAYISVGEYGIEWSPSEDYPAVWLKVSLPDGSDFEGTFNSSDSLPFFDFYDEDGNLRPNGNYNYELVAYPILDGETVALLESIADSPDRGGALLALRASGQLPEDQISQSGTFGFQDGKVLMENQHSLKTTKGAVSDADQPKVTKDIVHNDDVIIDGSLCVGFDCVSGESFGVDTIRLKENNLRIKFDDTSTSASFPRNDWQITANDSANGGASHLSIDDITNSKTPFRVEANAPSWSLFVEDSGDVGLNTSTPVLELHIADGDSPGIRLEQNGSSGFTPQTWDLAGNEANLFFRDVTNGSKLPFRIRPNTPTSAIDMFSDRMELNGGSSNYDIRMESDADENMFYLDASAEKIGIGTNAPVQTFQVEKENAGGNTTVWVKNTSNTADSNSRFYSQAAGSSGGDPKLVMSVSGGEVWEVGVDNSDSDKFKIAKGNDLGGNGYFTIDTSGHVGVNNTSPTHLLDVGSMGANCNGGAWVDGSSRDYKKNIERLSEEDLRSLFQILDEVDIVSFLYKQEQDTAHERVGVIAEDLPDILASADRKGLELGRNVGFLLGIVKALKAENERNTETLAEMKAEIEALKSSR